MQAPFLAGDDFLHAVQSAVAGSPDRLHLWWLGQSGFLVHWGGRWLLFDPYLSDSLTAKYAATDKPHARMTGLVIDPGRLDFIDVATATHNHTDHLDAATLGPLRAANPALQLVIAEANRGFVGERLGCEAAWPIGLQAGEAANVAGFCVHAVPAAHEELATDAAGRHKFLGFVIEAGPWTLYHSGDTLCYPGMVATLRRWRIDIALLPINGRAPERRVAGNLNGDEAAALAHAIGAGLAIPCHYDMFAFNTATPDAFVARCAALGQRCRVLRNGEGLSWG